MTCHPHRWRRLTAALCSASLLCLPAAVSGELTLQTIRELHLPSDDGQQGVATDGRLLYVQNTLQLFCYDLHGTLVRASAQRKHHHGGIVCVAGRIYAALSACKPGGTRQHWIRVYDAGSLELVASHDVGAHFSVCAGGIAHRKGRFYVGESFFDNDHRDRIVEFDAEFRCAKEHVVDNRSPYGIQGLEYLPAIDQFQIHSHGQRFYRINAQFDADSIVAGRVPFDLQDVTRWSDDLLIVNDRAAEQLRFVRVVDAERPPRPHRYRVGVAQVDITPDYPIRLNGFGSRRRESEGVTQRIWAKALAIEAAGEPPALLYAVDNLGLRMEMVNEVAARLQAKTSVQRAGIALTFTHTHTAPKVNGSSDNIFSVPIPEEHQRHIDRYTRELTDRLVEVGLQAVADLRPAQLSWGVGEVGFAKNRRTENGPVDHNLPLLVARDLQGNLRALYLTYACHCVTLSHNKISGDWAGYAQDLIQRRYPGAVALASIGAGSDANPDSGVRGEATEVALAQGAQIADEVARLLEGELRPLTGNLSTTLETIELPLQDPPDRASLTALAAAGGPQGYNATTQLARLDRGAPLQTHVSYPVQSWCFGDELAMVFLGGEVCVDYALRLRQELRGHRLWIHGYSNDFCSYIPSERLLREGGYGGGAEIPYFALPAPFRPGLETQIVAEVRRQLPEPFQLQRGTHGSRPKSPQEGLQSLRTHSGLRVELVACEPQVADPVAIDFAPDGGLWVAEMANYAEPVGGEFELRGRIRYLQDQDGDGHFERSSIYHQGLRFPTDVKVWRRGVLVCDAPQILYLEDTDGDGRSDLQRRLYSGFATHNPHGRVNSLRLGLDHWIYGSGGLFGGTIQSFNGQTVELGTRDFRLRPDTGEIEPVTGTSQQGRERDDWGAWFGCTNGTLLQHYPLADRYLRRNQHATPPPSQIGLGSGRDANRLFPVGELVLFQRSGASGSPTSACGLAVYRDTLLGPEFLGNTFTCEPVHQLVHRKQLRPVGNLFTARRPDREQDRAFLASGDPWFRPVQARTGPDGGLWIVDMYRYVIEHPQWIPPEQLAGLDTMAGQDRGRIYRVCPADRPTRRVPRLDTLPTAELAQQIDAANGTLRDLVQQLLVWRQDAASVEPLRQVVRQGRHPAGRLQALCTLDGLAALDEDLLLQALGDPHPQVRRHAIRLSEGRLERSPRLGQAVDDLLNDPAAAVRLQLAYSLGEDSRPTAAEALAQLAGQAGHDPLVRAALLSSLRRGQAPSVVAALLDTAAAPPSVLVDFVGVAARMGGEAERAEIVARLIRWTAQQGQRDVAYRLLAETLEQTPRAALSAAQQRQLRGVLTTARQVMGESGGQTARRLAAMRLVAAGSDDRAQEVQRLARMMAPHEELPLQLAAVETLGRLSVPSAAAALIETLTGASPQVRNRALDLLLEREPSSAALVDALAAQRVPMAVLDGVRRRRLLDHPIEDIRSRAEQVLGLPPASDRQALVARYLSAGLPEGDPDRGRHVFAQRCATCHRFDGVGYEVGPDLAALTYRTISGLLTAILEPNRDVDPRYLNFVASTIDGRVLSGMVRNETTASLTLLQPDGRQVELRRNQLEELRATGQSTMPEGLERDLGEQGLADVVAYVAAAGPSPKALPGNRPAVVRPSENGTLELAAAAAEIYGDEIVFEPQHTNIGYWHGRQDYVRWTIELKAAAKFDVYLEWACPPDAAGNRYVVQGPHADLAGVVASTGAWSAYQIAPVGQTSFPAGRSELVVHPQGDVRGALFDLRALHLVPAGQVPSFEVTESR